MHTESWIKNLTRTDLQLQFVSLHGYYILIILVSWQKRSFSSVVLPNLIDLYNKFNYLIYIFARLHIFFLYFDYEMKLNYFFVFSTFL